MFVDKAPLFLLFGLAFLSGIFFGMAIYAFRQYRKRRLEITADELPEIIKEAHARDGFRVIKGEKEED